MLLITSLTLVSHVSLKILKSNLDRDKGRDKDLKSQSLRKVLTIVKLRVKKIGDAQDIHDYLVIDQHTADTQNLSENERHTLQIQDTPQRKWLSLTTIGMHNHISVSNSPTIILILTTILLNLK
jgi:hypothetical protein